MKLRLMLFVCLFGGAVSAADIDRPNVIFLLCDDLGYGDVGYVQRYRPTGSVLIETPIIDNLATNGTILTDHYCASPVCAPSRASILTGKLAHSCSMNCADKNMCYDHAILETETLGTVMRDAGYATYAIGKWGVGGGGETESKLGANAIPRIAHPLARGFDHYYGFLDHAAGHTYYHYDDILNNCYAGIYESSVAKDVRPSGFEGQEYDTVNSANMIPTNDPNWKYWNATKTAEGRYSTDLFMARAMKYIEDHVKENEEAGSNRPFFMYFAINTVHGAGRKTKTVNGRTVVQNNTLGEYDADIHIPGGEYVSARNGDGSVKWPISQIEMPNRNQWVDPRYQNKGLNTVSQRYATSITRMDTALGDLVQFLKDKGIYENTIIIFTSDNGAAAEYGYNPSYLGSTGEFRGHKRDVLDGGQRIPAFISWPGNPAASKRVISEPSISPDWMGALKELIKDPTHVPVPVSPRVETIYISDGQSGQQRMKRIGDIVTVQQNGFGNKVQTYNIEDDRHQDHPLTDEYLPGFRYRFDGDFADSGLPCTFGSPNVLTAVGETMGTFVDHGDRKALKIAHGVTGQDNNENDYTKGRFQSVKSSLGNGANNVAFTAMLNAKVAPVVEGKKAVLWSFGGQASNFSALAADATNNKLYWYANGAQRAEIAVPDMAESFHHYAVLGSGSEVRLLVDGLLETTLSANYPATSANTYGLGAPSIEIDGLVEAVDTEIEDFTVYQQRTLSASDVREAIGAPSVKVGDREFDTLAEAVTACPNETLTILGDIDEVGPINLSGALTLEVKNNFRIATAFTGSGKIVKKGAGVLTLAGSLPSGGLTVDLDGVTPGASPWTVASFGGVPNLDKITLANGPEGATLAAYGKRVVVLAVGETLEQPKIIALNLNAGRGRNGNGSEADKLANGTDAGIPDWMLPGSAWTQVMTASSSEAQELTIFDEATQSAVVVETAPKVTWSANNNYTVGNSSASVLEGYLDDGGSHAQVSMTDIPFKTYDVLILSATDTGDKKFSPITVNGRLYKSDENGEGVPASGAADTWGASQRTTITLGINAFYVRDLTGPLSITGGANANGARGGISAVVVFGQLSEVDPAPIVAPEATVMWDANFTNGTTIGNYTLDVASAETIGEDGVVTIGSTGMTAGGVRINHNPLTSGCDAITVLMKISDLPTNIADMMLVSIRNVNGSMVNDPDGIWFANGLVPYEISGGVKGTDAGNPQTALTANLTDRRLAMVYAKGGTTKLYEIIDGTATEVFSKNAYKSLTVAGISIGQTRAGSQDLNAATGMKLHSVAVFERALSADEIAAYHFPSDAPPSPPFIDPEGSEVSAFGMSWDYYFSGAGATYNQSPTWEKTTNWAYGSTGENFTSSDGAKIPQLVGNNVTGSVLFDANLFNEWANVKTVTATTLNGASLKIGVTNGVSLTIGKVGTAISNMDLYVDATSKLTINEFDTQLTPSGTQSFHIDAEKGLSIGGPLLGGTYQLYLGEKGSITVSGRVNKASGVVFSSVKISVATTGAKRINSRTLLSYGGKVGSFGFSNSPASDVNGGTLTKKDSVSVSDPVGSYAFVDSGSAIVVNWIEGSDSGSGGDDPVVPYDGPVADAVWIGSELNGATKDAYTLNLNGNSYANGAITISGDSGVLIDWDTASTGPFTVIVKYENLNLNSSSEQVLATVKDGNYADHVGVHLQARNANYVKGIWQNNTWQNTNTKVAEEPMPSASGIFTLGYKRDGGTQLFYQPAVGGAAEKVYDYTGLRSGGSTYSGVAIGGKRGGGWAASDMKITAIALFTGKRLTEDELAAYRFPESEQFIFENTDCDASNPGWGNYVPATLTIPESTELPAGTKLRIKSVTFAMRVNNGAPASQSAEYLTINGVQSESRNGLTETPEVWSLGNRMTYEFTNDAIVTVGEAATLGTVKGNGVSSDIRIYLFRTTEDKYGYILLSNTVAMNTYRPVYKIVAERYSEDPDVPVSGEACLYDWTFTNTVKSVGKYTTELTLEGSGETYLVSKDLYAYGLALNIARTPYGDISYPSDDWSATVVGILPSTKSVPLATFGTKSDGFIGVVAGEADEVVLGRTTGGATYAELGTTEVESANAASHVYTVVKTSSAIKLFVDGEEKISANVANATVGSGIQVGSVHGNVPYGITKVTTSNVGNAAIQAIRIFDHALSAKELVTLSKEFPVMMPSREPTTIYWKGGDGTLDGGTIFRDGEGNDIAYMNGDVVVIDGEAKVTLTRSVGDLHIKNGAILQIASASGSVSKLFVDEGGTFDVNGVQDKTYPIVLNGGTLANYGTAVGDGKAQFWNLEVAADSFIDAQSDFGTIASKYGSQEFKLGGNKLTKLGAGKFFIAEATFTGGGTLDIQEGAIVLRNGATLPNNLRVKVGLNGETITAGASFTIKSGKITFDISACAEMEKEITLIAAGATQISSIDAYELTGFTSGNWELQIIEGSLKAVNAYELIRLDGVSYPTLEAGFARIQRDGTILEIVDADRLVCEDGKLILDGEEVDLTQYAVTLAEGEDGAITVSRLMEGGELTIAEICPKPTTKDPNGIEAGWVELVNIGTGWAELSDYSFGRFNRGKKLDMTKVLALPSRAVAPGSKVRFYTTEGYVEGEDLLFVEPKMTAAAMAEIKGVLVYPAKVNPKKYPMVTLAKGGETICSVVIPCDTPDDASVVVEPTDETVLGGATRHYLKVGATRTAIGPEVGPLYGIKHDFSDLNAAPPAIPGEDYAITLDVNPVYGGGEKDAIGQVFLVYRTDLDETTRKEVEMAKGEVVSGHGQQWTAAIPFADFPAAGHLIQWKAKIVDAAGNTWLAPQFLGPDDGYEWYGTIVEPTADQLSESLTTFHLFADAETADDKNAQNRNMKVMNIDYDEFMSGAQYADLRTRHPYGARVSFYDSSTSQYYDNVRIDLRGNSSKGFNKKSHGLRFGKTHPLSTVDCVSGETLEIRKSSFIAEFGDPSFLRQMTAFWLFNKHDSPAPFHYPARLNLNGEFYQLGFHSERFTDELIEDVYGLDPLGYGYKNIGSFGNGTTAGGIEKKTPDDGNESDLSVLNAFCNTLPSTTVTSDADKAKYTKIVAEKMDIPAWINYIALTKITQECDDVWANLSGYYDNPQLIDGVRPGSTGTWRPLAYDMQLTFGQWHHADYAAFTGLMSNQDWFKSHPLYGGYAVRAHTGEGGGVAGKPNRAYEAIFQSEKFRRLFLRRVRTLMDEELGAPDATGEETWQTSTVNFMVQMRKMAALMTVEAEKDHAQWGYCNGAGNVNVWGSNYPKTIEEAMADIWNNYVVPRRVHLYETHAAEGHAAEQIGYGEKLIAGIPAAQTAITELKAGFSAEYNATLGAVVIRNANDEAIDLSNWKLSGPINMTIPEGTVIDMAIDGVPGEVYVTADRRATVAAFGDNLFDQVIVGNGTAGSAEEIGLVASDGTDVLAVEKSEQELYLRLWGFAGAPDGVSTDENEFIVFTNLNQEATLDASGARIQFEKYGATPENRCNFALPAGTVIEAGGWVRFNQADVPWTKITDGFQEIVLTDANGIEIERFSNLDQATIIGEKGSGYMAVHNLETDEWYKLLITEAPGYEPPPPPPPMPLTWANTNVTECITLPAGYSYNFANAHFDGGLILEPGEYTIKNDGSTSTNTASFVSAAGASITFVGKGRFELTGEDITNSLFTAKDLYITKGTFAIDVSVPNSANKVAAVSLSGNFGLSGEGKLDMTLTGNQPYGIELTNKKMSAAFEAGVFTATLGGTKASAFKFKGSDAVTLSGGTMEVAITGTGAKVLNGGTIVFEDGYVCNIEGDETARDATVFESGKTLTVNGGVFDISVPGAGSQIFTTTDDPEEKDLTLTINGGEFNLLAGDDCVKSAGNDAVNDPETVNTKRNVVINGGNFYGVSLGNDVIDSNGDIIITGGNILAYTTAVEDDGNGSTGLDVNEGRVIEVTGGNVIAIGGPNSSFHYDGGLAYTADELDAATFSEKFVELDGQSGKFNTRVWAKIPALDVETISLFVFTPGIDPAVAPTVQDEAPSEEFATGFHDLYIDDVPPGELVITRICARCQPNVPAAKDLGWILLENVGGKPLELSDYKVYCVNRGKKMKVEEAFTLPAGTLGVGETFKVWTSESPVDALPAEATPLYEKKINQKKYPMVQLYKAGAVQQTVLVPVDLADEAVHTVATDRRPTVSSLYGVKDAPDPWQAFAQAKIGEDYSVTLPILPADMSAAEEDQIADVKLIYQIGFGPIQTNETAMTKSEAKDKMNGWTYTGTIPGSTFTKAGELVRFAVAITDAAGRTFRAPSFQNKDDGYEWYGTIVEPAEGMTDAKVQTFYLFADDASLKQMDVDVDKQDKSVVPYNARVGIYDALTGLYYDNVRIDLRGNTTARFPKKSHGLRFSKAQPLSCTDPVTGTVFEEIRKTSFVADYMDPAYIRQSLSFWLFREAGAKAPYDYPVKLNLNGEFFQLAWNSNRFTDELIEDVYGLDPLGYAFKNCGTIQPGHHSSITTEKKTPDDENESDISVEKAFENTLPYNGNDEAMTAENEDAKYTKNVVNTFNLPAWLNYMAMTRITSETDDTWSNISLYYDVNGTGTWMPLAYDCHLSFGSFFCHDGKNGIRADVDFFKSHPFYGGRRVQAHSYSFDGSVQGYGSNGGLESIYQSPKFRRLYLRRLRTLMDELLEAPGTAREDSKLWGYIATITNATAKLAAADRAKWPLSGIYNFQNDSMNCWPNVASMTPTMGIEDLWNNYVEPRRVHLFETHSVHNTAKGVGYNNRLSAGIPDKQSELKLLRRKISAVYDDAIGAVVIKNANIETIDLSGFVLTGPVNWTLPSGTILDQATNGVDGELYVTADRRATVAAMTVVDQVVVGNGEIGDGAIELKAADGTVIIGEIPEEPVIVELIASRPDEELPATIVELLKNMPANTLVVLKGESEEDGFIVDYVGNFTFENLHLVVESGEHSFRRSNGGATTQFANGATPENPTILVKDGATLNLCARDLSGWNCAVDTMGVIRVADGGTLNLRDYSNNTFYFNQQFYLDAGADVHIYCRGDHFRLNGGVNEMMPQIYMPPSEGGVATITIESDSTGLKIAADSHPDAAFYIENGSTLIINGNVTGSGRSITKYGAGKLIITGTCEPILTQTLLAIDGAAFFDWDEALRYIQKDGSVLTILDESRMTFKAGVLTLDGKVIDLASLAIKITDEEGALIIKPDVGEGGTLLYITEIMPKPTDSQNRGTLEGMDPNGLESGWVELRNDGDKWVDLKDYRFVRVNRKKATKPEEVNNFPSMLVAPHSFAVFYTSERYSNSADQTVSAFETGTFDGQPMILPPKLHGMMVWGDKVNPKKSPFVRLYYVPGGDLDNAEVIDTVIVPSDLPEGASIIVGRPEEGKSTARWICEAPTRGAENPSTDGLVRIGPNVGPLYEGKKQKKHDSDNEFARNAPPANPDEDYVVTFSANPVLAPTKDIGTVYRDEDKLASIVMVVRTDLDDNTLTEIPVDFATKDGSDTTDWGDTYTATIPKSKFPARGHLIQWKFKLVDKAGSEWTSPSYHNPDDGYEWYGTIVEPTAEQMSEKLTTWHMFAEAGVADVPGNGDSNFLMNKDSSDSGYKTAEHPNGARVAIYDSSTSNYYDYVRVDLRGNTTASFKKKSHGLRFAKAHPLTTKDCVTGEDIEEVRKTSLIAEWSDPSFIRQMTAFWLWRKAGNNVPYDFPIRCNMNGKFYQLAFCSERFTDELIEDIYGLDKFGYSYKSVGTLESGGGTTAGGIEKKTPDDEDEKNITVLQNELRSRITAAKNVPGTTEAALSSTETDPTGLDNAALTKTVVERFDLAAWINYLASARITQEADDVWGNLCAYYDNPTLLEGVRGTGTWMPLGYDFNLSFGQHYKDGGTSGMMATEDWFKSHPFYGGWRVRCWNNTQSGTVNYGNCGFESVLQSSKFRRLFLRRLRTLMDTYLGEPNESETLANSERELITTMRAMVDMVREDAAQDRTIWGYGTGTMIDDWGSANFPKTVDDGLKDIYDNYIVPRREHLYVTHSVTNTAKAVGYGSNLNAGIPLAQSAIADLRAGITAEYDARLGAVIIRNANEETIDLSDWELSGPVTMTLPAGTVIDQAMDGVSGEVYVTADRRATVAAMAITDQVIVGNGETGKSDAKVTLTAADGTKVIFEPSQVYNFLRLHSFDGLTPAPSDGDTDEWITLTNLSNEVQLDLAGVKIVFLKDGDALADAKCVVTLDAGTTLAASGSLMLKQSDFDWKKITNGKLNFYLTDADGMSVQSLYINQKDAAYANYYGEGGPGGAFYLAATTFAQASETFVEVAYPATEIEVDPTKEPVDVEAASEDEATNKVVLVVTVPEAAKEAVSEELYKGYFMLKAEEKLDGEGQPTGKWTVEAVLNPDVVQPEIEETESIDEPFTMKDEGGEVTVKTLPGLRYELIRGTEVGVIDDVRASALATGDKLTLTDSLKTGETKPPAAFYRVRVTK